MSGAADWRPAAPLERLRERAALLAGIRDFFLRAGVLEVETPVCSVGANTDPHIESMATRYRGPGAARGVTLYLHTSPEFAMKRLLAAGSGPIYQICRVFRDSEAGRLHNPEFTMLEWYRPGFDHHRLMDEVAALLSHLLPRPLPVQRISYGELFQRELGVDPHVSTADRLRALAVAQGIGGAQALDLTDRDAWLDLLMSHCIEPGLGRGTLCFVYDYPASQASLARIARDGTHPVAERFELYMEGVELANGFHELADPLEQRHRFEADLEWREGAGLPRMPMDERLLAALEAGLPSCAGVALGVDRLLMCLCGARHIEQVLAFPLERA
ncbi:MAG: EF-P lysine aminoacylase EpmA [Candidatus Sedimenticola endophacoides]